MHEEQVCNRHLADRLANRAGKAGNDIRAVQIRRGFHPREPDRHREGYGRTEQINRTSAILQREWNQEDAPHGQSRGISAETTVQGHHVKAEFCHERAVYCRNDIEEDEDHEGIVAGESEIHGFSSFRPIQGVIDVATRYGMTEYLGIMDWFLLIMREYESQYLPFSSRTVPGGH